MAASSASPSPMPREASSLATRRVGEMYSFIVFMPVLSTSAATVRGLGLLPGDAGSAAALMASLVFIAVTAVGGAFQCWLLQESDNHLANEGCQTAC